MSTMVRSRKCDDGLEIQKITSFYRRPEPEMQEIRDKILKIIETFGYIPIRKMKIKLTAMGYTIDMKTVKVIYDENPDLKALQKNHKQAKKENNDNKIRSKNVQYVEPTEDERNLVQESPETVQSLMNEFFHTNDRELQEPILVNIIIKMREQNTDERAIKYMRKNMYKLWIESNYSY